MAILSISNLTGCKTAAPVQQTDKAIITNVDSAMKEWAWYVRSGKATQAQMSSVHVAYKRYHDAQKASKLALEKAMTSKNPHDVPGAQAANDAAADSQTHLLILINSLIK